MLKPLLLLRHTFVWAVVCLLCTSSLQEPFQPHRSPAPPLLLQLLIQWWLPLLLLLPPLLLLLLLLAERRPLELLLDYSWPCRPQTQQRQLLLVLLLATVCHCCCCLLGGFHRQLLRVKYGTGAPRNEVVTT